MAIFRLDPATFVHEHPATCNHRNPDSAIHRPFATAFMAIQTALAITSNVCTTPRGLNLSLAWSPAMAHTHSLGVFFTIVSSLLHISVRRRFSGTVYTIGFWITI